MTTLHHLALGARDPDRLATFYRDVLGLPEVERHHTDDGTLRSVWLELGHGVLMIERLEGPDHDGAPESMRPGLFLLAVQIDPTDRDTWERRLDEAGCVIEDRSDFTTYTRDPEGNRVAVSHYPLDR